MGDQSRAARSGCAGVLPRQFHQLLHSQILGEPRFHGILPWSEAVLLQHRRNGDRSVEMARRQIHGETGVLDENTEEEPNLPAGFIAAFSAGVRWRRERGRAPMEPAWAGRGQPGGAMPKSPPGSGESPPLEWQRQAVAETGLEATMPAG